MNILKRRRKHSGELHQPSKRSSMGRYFQTKQLLRLIWMNLASHSVYTFPLQLIVDSLTADLADLEDRSPPAHRYETSILPSFAVAR
jgi:hypothetical protein